MIHIATVHWKSDFWIDIQQHYIQKHVSEPYRMYAFLNHVPGDHSQKFFYHTMEAITRHPDKLNILAELICQTADDDSELIMFIDGDAFPVADLFPYVRNLLEKYPLVGGPETGKPRRSTAPPVFLRYNRRVLEAHTWRLETGRGVEKLARRHRPRRRRPSAG